MDLSARPPALGGLLTGVVCGAVTSAPGPSSVQISGLGLASGTAVGAVAVPACDDRIEHVGQAFDGVAVEARLEDALRRLERNPGPAPFRPRLSLARLRGGPCRATEPASQHGIKPMLERIPGRRRRQGHACGAPLRGLRSLTATTTRNRAYDRFDAALHARPNPSPKPSTKSGQAQAMQGSKLIKP